MLEAKRLSKNWTVVREVKLLGQLYNCMGNLSAKGIIICSIHASQTQARNQGGGARGAKAPKVRILILNIQVRQCSRLNWI